MPYPMKARTETTTETSNVSFMKMIYMQLYIDLFKKRFFYCKKDQFWPIFFMTPQYDLKFLWKFLRSEKSYLNCETEWRNYANFSLLERLRIKDI
jgi:hypothetical protein